MAQSLMTHSPAPLAPQLTQLRQQAPCGKAPPETERYPQQATNGALCKPCTQKILPETVDKWTHFVHNISRISSAVKKLLLGTHQRPGVSRVLQAGIVPHREVDNDEMIGYR